MPLPGVAARIAVPIRLPISTVGSPGTAASGWSPTRITWIGTALR
jgi:hypothetical protein